MTQLPVFRLLRWDGGTIDTPRCRQYGNKNLSFNNHCACALIINRHFATTEVHLHHFASLIDLSLARTGGFLVFTILFTKLRIADSVRMKRFKFLP